MTDTATTPGWYQSNVTTIEPDARSLLEEYSGLQSDEVLSHVLALVSSPPAGVEEPGILQQTNALGKPISEMKLSKFSLTHASGKCGF